MKWKSPPLGLFAFPTLIGFSAAFVGFSHATFLVPMIGLQSGTYFGDVMPLFFSWICLLLFTVGSLPFIPEEWGDKQEIRYGVWTGVALFFIPQICGIALILCAFWFLTVIGMWAFLSTYQWKYDVPPFRTGLWFGLGGLSGMFIGSFVMGAILF